MHVCVDVFLCMCKNALKYSHPVSHSVSVCMDVCLRMCTHVDTHSQASYVYATTHAHTFSHAGYILEVYQNLSTPSQLLSCVWDECDIHVEKEVHGYSILMLWCFNADIVALGLCWAHFIDSSNFEIIY